MPLFSPSLLSYRIAPLNSLTPSPSPKRKELGVRSFFFLFYRTIVRNCRVSYNFTKHKRQYYFNFATVHKNQQTKDMNAYS